MELDPTTVDGWNALNERQQKFCMAYLADGNGRAAAIAAGYSEKCAEVTACKLKHDKKVAAVLDALRRARFAQDALSIEEAQSILAGIARGRLGKFLRSGGSVDIEAIRQGGAEVDSYSRTDGDKSSSEKIKLRDPVGAVKLYAQLAGWTEKKDSQVATVGPINYFIGFKREAQ